MSSNDDSNDDASLEQEEMSKKLLTKQQIETFQTDGVLVVENILSSHEVNAALQGLHETLKKHGIDSNHLRETGLHLTRLSSTNGSGGVLDIYYEPWQIQGIAANAKLFQATSELWEAAYCHSSTSSVNNEDDDHQWMFHPYGPFDSQRGYMYMDRLGYRLPTQLAYDLGKTTASKESSRKPSPRKKALPIQRSLTPHLDCCPSELFSTTTTKKKKWRPIQCFVALTDALHPHQGGFEAAKGFHREFHTWAAHRPPSSNGIPAPCVGEYTHLRPQEDANVVQRIAHVAVPAGSAVFWDTRIPHANSYHHNGASPRVVVYCSFLPDVSINRSYVAAQLGHWKAGRYPSGDQWITDTSNGLMEMTLQEEEKKVNDQYRHIREILSTPLARKLAGWEPWDTESTLK